MKKFISLLIVILMVFSLVACNIENNDTTINDPNDENSNQNDDTTEDNSDDKNENDNKYSQYSQMLQNVLTRSEYTTMLYPSDYNSAALDPHPFAFLEKEGFDIQAIKSGAIECRTRSFVLDNEPNNLYIQTVVYEAAYNTNYLLKYELTEQEMADYLMIYRGEGQVFYYYQCAFLNNEISRIKTPTIVGKSKIEPETQEYIYQYNKKYPLNRSDRTFVTVYNPNENGKNTVLMIYAPDYKDLREVMLLSTEVMFADVNTNYRLVMEGDVYVSPRDTQYFIFNNYERYTATFFNAQNAMLDYIYCKPFTID